jgi:hypothetical protein
LVHQSEEEELAQQSFNFNSLEEQTQKVFQSKHFYLLVQISHELCTNYNLKRSNAGENSGDRFM